MRKRKRQQALDILNHYKTPGGEPLTSAWEESKLGLQALIKIEEEVMPLLYSGIDQMSIATILQSILSEV